MTTHNDTMTGGCSGRVDMLMKGTIVRAAIQCECPDTLKTGDFLFRGGSHREKGSRVSPIFDNYGELYLWSKSRFDAVSNGSVILGFICADTHTPRLTMTPTQPRAICDNGGTELCNLNPEQFAVFDEVAKEEGYPSGRAAANDLGLWSMPLQDALDTITQPANA